MIARALDLSLMVALILCGPALAQSDAPPTPVPVVLTDEQERYPLGLHLEILEDPSGELTIDEVSSPEFDARFAPSQVEVPNYGFTDSVYWVRFRVDNQTHLPERWLLEQGFANTHFIDLYTPLPDGSGFSVKQSGVLRPSSNRDVSHPRVVFDLAIQTGSQQTYYLRIQNGASMTLPLTVWNQTAFLDDALVEMILVGIFFGVLSGLLIYSLFLLLSSREIVYLYFAILLATLIIEEASYSGYLQAYVLPAFTGMQHIQPVTFSLLMISIVLFSDAFLELRTRVPVFHRINLVILCVWGVLVALIPFNRYSVMAVLMVPWSLFSSLFVLSVVLVCWARGFRFARIFMLVYFGMVASLMLGLVTRLGLIPSTFLSENLYRFGFLAVALSWSIALADRINQLKAETEDAYRALRHSEHQLSQILEGLPIGVAVYGKDQQAMYINRRTAEILSNPAQDIEADASAGRTLAQAISYFSLRVAGTDQEYPLEGLPVYRALQGESGHIDDLEADLGGKRVPLELWASPVMDDAGNIESAVAAIQDISQRKTTEAKLEEYRLHLEELVRQRTAQLYASNERLRAEADKPKQLEALLQKRLDWLAAVSLVNQAMARSMAHPADFAQSFDLITEIVNRLLNVKDCFVGELDEGHENLKILAHSCRSDLHPDLLGSLSLLPDSVRSSPGIAQGKLSYFSRDELISMSGPMGVHLHETDIHIIVLVNLRLRERVIGFLGLEIHDQERTITAEETTLLEIFAFDIARLIDDTKLFAQTRALITAEERSRLARDLHDSVTQVLFSAALVAETLPRLWDRNPERARQSLENLRRMTRGALAEMRTMLLELRPSAVTNLPLDELLAQLAEAATSRTGLSARLFIEQIPSLPEEVQISFYRIAQEALNNVVKHAQAKSVHVSLGATPIPASGGGSGHKIRLVILDDGVGFSSGMRRSDRLGIGIMHERAAAIGADLTLESQPGRGTRVILTWCNESRDEQ